MSKMYIKEAELAAEEGIKTLRSRQKVRLIFGRRIGLFSSEILFLKSTSIDDCKHHALKWVFGSGLIRSLTRLFFHGLLIMARAESLFWC